eukprot:scaffold190803_cov18-Prasinocladus_malaysianus.AAC.1
MFLKAFPGGHALDHPSPTDTLAVSAASVRVLNLMPAGIGKSGRWNGGVRCITSTGLEQSEFQGKQ